MAKFLIIDDHPLFREALHSAIKVAYSDASIWETASLSEALDTLGQEGVFDLALLDLKIPDTVGLEGFLELRTRYPSLPIVVVSGHEDPQIINAVMSGGASGFIPKSTKKDSLTGAIKSVIEGELYIPEDHRAASLDAPDQIEQKNEIVEKLATLTPQQLRVIKMIRDGLLNKQIAYELRVGETTVKAHVSEILKKLGVNNRTQAAMEFSKLSADDFKSLTGDLDIRG